jgi:glycosyltransferase involved in cell wall biosynthesis
MVLRLNGMSERVSASAINRWGTMLVGGVAARLAQSHLLRPARRILLTPFPDLKERLRNVVWSFRPPIAGERFKSPADALGTFSVEALANDSALGEGQPIPEPEDVFHAPSNIGQIYYWIETTRVFPRNTGIQRVTRQLARELLNLGFHLIPVRWDRRRCCLAPAEPKDLEHLAQWNGPRPDQWHDWIEPQFAAKNSWFLLPELMLDLSEQERGRLLQLAKHWNLQCAAVFYDAIPWKMRDMHLRQVARAHKEYMLHLADYDLVFPISEFSRGDLITFLRTELPRPLGSEARIKTVTLSGEFPEFTRVQEARPARKAVVTILCAGTVEPRKNHERLLRAFSAAVARSSAQLRLILVGGSYGTGPTQTSRVREYIEHRSDIFWEEDADDHRLCQLFLGCDFTVYPSVEEGFGLPILESIWYGKPCICANFGAMAEAAEGGGCVLVDVFDEEALASAIQALAEDPARIKRLSQEAVARSVRSWKEYAAEIGNVLSVASEAPSSCQQPALQDERRR